MERTTFPGTLDSLAAIRQLVKEAAQQTGLSKKRAYNLLLAVDEIATNSITYGYEETSTSGVIDVLVEQLDDQLVVTLEDDGPLFDPLQRELPGEDLFTKPLAERTIGGMGIYLTIKGVDVFRHEYVNQRNRNIFVMKTGDT